MPATFKRWGLDVPVPHWSIQAAAMLALVWLSLWGSQVLWPRDPSEFVALREQAKHLTATVEEFNRHLGSVPEHNNIVFDDARGLLVIGAFGDGCVLIKRRVSRDAAVQVKLILDVTRDVHETAAPSSRGQAPETWWRWMNVSAAGRCLTPHPGNFRWWYGERIGCWVQIWREYQDGCIGSQLFNSCSAAWDVEQDGSPKVRWARCVH